MRWLLVSDYGFIPVCDDRGTLMGVADKAGALIERIYYNSTGLQKTYFPAGNQFFESDDGGGNNIGRSSYIRFGWPGMYHEPAKEI